VFLVAHEAFHYLRKTRQVERRHGEIEADAFALKMLEQYRDGSEPTTPTETQLSME
jgi:Zn-dependent peptidase ImmA (M78 family)